MKSKLRIAGIILIVISLAIGSSMAIIVRQPEYNYTNYGGFRPPSWLFLILILLVFSGYILIAISKKRQKRSEIKPPAP
jgi:hypothetical protein